MTPAIAPITYKRSQVRTEIEMKKGLCVDDKIWVDDDGDGCAVYAKHIQNNEISQSDACEYSDGAAKLHCPATCGKCQQQSGIISGIIEESFSFINNALT